MQSIQEMSMEELLKAIDFCEDTSSNLTSHGQEDDYLVGSQQMIAIYRDELDRRAKKTKEKNT